MKHLFIITYIVNLFLGITTLVLMAALKTYKIERFKYFPFFYIYFSIIMLIATISYYFFGNITGVNHTQGSIFYIVLAYLGVFIGFFISLHYSHILALTFARKANIVFAAISLIIGIAVTIGIIFYFSERKMHNDRILFNGLMNLHDLPLLLAVIYFLPLTIKYYPALGNPLLKNFIKWHWAVLIIFLPWNLYEHRLIFSPEDIRTGEYFYDYLWAFPVMYGAIGLIHAYYMVRIRLNQLHADRTDFDFSIVRGRYGISLREEEIIKLVISGFSNNEIADEFDLSVSTVKNHLYRIFQKTGARNRTDLVSIITREGTNSF